MKSNDPDMYARLTVERPEEEARAALDAFVEDLYDLRVKHGICDVLVVSVASTQGEDKALSTISTFGNSANLLPMAAAAFRFARQRNDAEALAMAGIESTAEDGK